jgi:hypothetical protein
MGASFMNNENELIIHDLINKSLDGSITSPEFEELNRLIKSDPECAAYYVSSIKTHLAFAKAGRLFRKHADETLSDSNLSLQEFAEYEKTAPVVQIAKTEVQSKQVQEAVQTVPVRKISKFPIITVLVSCAALLMVFLYVYLNPQMSEVATLTDSINPQWVNPESSAQIGSRLLTTTKPVVLKQGIIKILYDNDIEVLIEAPAEYQILSSKEMILRSGRLFAKVSPAGRGFAVKTNNTRIVDLGTEFGVYCDPQDKTELHVFKGKTVLSSTKDKSGENRGVVYGQAVNVNAAGEIKEIRINKSVFVRAIDSKTNMVWRTNSVDLADIVRTGNGMGTGNSLVRLDPIKGFTGDWHLETSSAKGYLYIQNFPFIDGIFIPDGDTPQIISSRGDLFKECPDTNGLYYVDLFANPTPKILWAGSSNWTIQFNGQEYSDQGKSCIVMHGNHGITFDLDAIRKSYDYSITRFTSRIGVADLEDKPCNADFYVLLDGRLCYSLRQYKQKGVLNDVSVKIEDTDRFLTLVTTDGTYSSKLDQDAANSTFLSDWSIFTEPFLELE